MGAPLLPLQAAHGLGGGAPDYAVPPRTPLQGFMASAGRKTLLQSSISLEQAGNSQPHGERLCG